MTAVGPEIVAAGSCDGELFFFGWGAGISSTSPILEETGVLASVCQLMTIATS